MLILGIETSCDETAAAVVDNGRIIKSNIIASQVEIHAKYGGVVPEIASRHHLENILPVIMEALNQSGASFKDLEAIAVTAGPGLVGTLLIGLAAAKSLCYALDKPLIPVNHLVAHVSAIFLEDKIPAFPFIALVVSGGHTDLYLVESHTNFKLIGETRDDAAGEAYDKIAKLMGLGYPGGPVVDKLAAFGNKEAISFPRALMDKDSFDFSFSGLKTAVLYYLQQHHPEAIMDKNAKVQDLIQENIPQEYLDLLASFQAAIIDALVHKTKRALESCSIRDLVICGGVACNSYLRQTFFSLKGIRTYIPKPILCTDNGAMIAAAGYYRYKKQGGAHSPLDFDLSNELLPGLSPLFFH